MVCGRLQRLIVARLRENWALGSVKLSVGARKILFLQE